MWPFLTILCALTAVAAHLWWRRRFARAQAEWEGKFEKITAREQGLRLEIQSQQEAVLHSMVEGLLVLDEQGRIQLVNRAFARMFEIAGDIRGKRILEALRWHELADLIQGVQEKNQSLEHEFRPSGIKERWIKVNAAPISSGGERPSGSILVFHDLTRLKKLERTREEFVANVSHELRTPLSLIKGYVETLLNGAKNDPEVSTKFLETIDRNAERLRELIEDLLTISALESGRVVPDLRPVALQPLAEKVLEDFRSRADSKGVTLASEMPELTVLADAGQLEQVLGNLVDNAIKYGGTKGKVTVGARATEGRELELFVRDTGPGIPPEAIDRVFERFYRIDKARTREQGGTGLGLAIVKHIIQSHGGRVWVESTVGTGATFCFTLPKEPIIPSAA